MSLYPGLYPQMFDVGSITLKEERRSKHVLICSISHKLVQYNAALAISWYNNNNITYILLPDQNTLSHTFVFMVMDPTLKVLVYIGQGIETSYGVRSLTLKVLGYRPRDRNL